MGTGLRAKMHGGLSAFLGMCLGGSISFVVFKIQGDSGTAPMITELASLQEQLQLGKAETKRELEIQLERQKSKLLQEARRELEQDRKGTQQYWIDSACAEHELQRFPSLNELTRGQNSSL